jgi:hypothetical protein
VPHAEAGAGACSSPLAAGGGKTMIFVFIVKSAVERATRRWPCALVRAADLITAEATAS